MNYLKHYNSLIERAKEREILEYTETHHILPKCMGGLDDDDDDNLIKLTAREHFIAHLLLYKIYPNNFGLIKAINMMCVSSKDHKYHRINNRMYSWLKIKFSEEMSRSQTGEGNSQFGTIWIHNLYLKENKKIKKDELEFYKNDNWIKGRKMSFEIKIKNCLICGTIIPYSKANLCSKLCRTYYKAPHYKLIDENIDMLVEKFKETKSIEATLKFIDLTNKIGNQYLSIILKSKGFTILTRRNTNLASANPEPQMGKTQITWEDQVKTNSYDHNKH